MVYNELGIAFKLLVLDLIERDILGKMYINLRKIKFFAYLNGIFDDIFDSKSFLVGNINLDVVLISEPHQSGFEMGKVTGNKEGKEGWIFFPGHQKVH